ncbi:LAFE_0F04302g1_1 [Lachancea fermentati]|uniref:Heat shock transcription factor n=1 Tax=Lachancea fermentati TaxID=4955 RepID=A0A1G4MEI6_LACFM|nr:LAFE_0F04302g1_1 [Lachancea fermentati]
MSTMARAKSVQEDSGRRKGFGIGASLGSTSGPQSGVNTNTAFIHKLYSMLEDKDMEDLIWWTPSQTSFLIKPNEKFSKALATYFKHANVASFVRQLNMYGFHKVSDHNGNKGKEDDNTAASEDSVNLWEFKHNSGAFRKGDMEGLKLIKRRSSRNQISARKNSNSAASTPMEHDDMWVEPSVVRSNSLAEIPSVYSSYPGNVAQSAPNCGVLYPQPDPLAQQYPRHQSQSHVPPQALPQSQGGPLQSQQAIQPQSQIHGQTSVQHPQSQQQQQQQQQQASDVSHSVTGLKAENGFLQSRYDHAVEELRNTNMDMIKMLDLVHGLVTLSTQSNAQQPLKSEEIKRSTTPLSSQQNATENTMSPGQSLPQQGLRADQLISEISRVRNNIHYRLQRSMEMQQMARPSQAAVHEYQGNPTYPVYVPGRPPMPNLNAASPAPSYAAAGSQGAPPPPSHAMVVPPGYTSSFYSNSTSNPPDFYSTGATAGSGGPTPYLMMNPFEQKSSASVKNRHMSVFMDPLAPAPMPSSGAPVSASVSPNPIQQQQHMQQQQGVYVSHPVAMSTANQSRHDSRTDVRHASSHPESTKEIKGPERRPISPSIPDRLLSSSPNRVQSKSQGVSMYNPMTYKPYYPYGTMPSAGPTSAVPQQPQFAPGLPQSSVPHYQMIAQQKPGRPQQHPIPRAQSPLNPGASASSDQHKIVKPTPINPAKSKPESAPQPREENSNSTSRVYALLNYESKEPPAKKMKS